MSSPNMYQRRGAIDLSANETKRKSDNSPDASHSDSNASPQESDQPKRHRRGKRRRAPKEHRAPREENAPPRQPRLNEARRLSNRTTAELTPGMSALRDALSVALPRERAEGMGRWAGEVREVEKTREDAVPKLREEIEEEMKAESQEGMSEGEGEREAQPPVKSRRSKVRAAKALRKQRLESLRGGVHGEETRWRDGEIGRQDASRDQFDIDIYGDEETREKYEKHVRSGR